MTYTRRKSGITWASVRVASLPANRIRVGRVMRVISGMKIWRILKIMRIMRIVRFMRIVRYEDSWLYQVHKD